MQDIINKTYIFAEQYFSNDNSGHDFEHIKRVYANVNTLLLNETQANKFIVKMGALLHDVDDHKFNTDGNNTLRFLQTLNLNESLINDILKTINAISFSKSGSKPVFDTLEMKILSDADKLDAIGAIGVARTIMYNTSKKRQLFNESAFPIKNITLEQYKQNGKVEDTAINHFFDKLLKLKNAMQTDAGKKEAEKRHLFMISFLRQFFEEQNLDSWNEYLDNYLRNDGFLE